MRNRLPLLLLLLLSFFSLAAQPLLDSRHFLLDGSLTDGEVRERGKFVFNNLQRAIEALPDTATLYVMPWVYWADDPDDATIAVGRDGREPFGLVIRSRCLRIVGLGGDAGDVVIASARGQMEGAVGNFTMLDCHVDDLTVENLTMGNFCNVDLEYPLRPELGRKRRSEAITQAHVGYVSGGRLTCRKVRFISRLNLNPLTGAEVSVYDSCHFECTDDALNGAEGTVYRHCTFHFYGEKPFWSTRGAGPLLIDCDFYAMGAKREMYFCKQGGPLTLVGCRYHAPDGCYVGWAPYPQPWLRCYQKDFTLNGEPYLIGPRQPQNTVVLEYVPERAPLLSMSRREAVVQSPDTLRLTASEEKVAWSVEPGYEGFATLSPQGATLMSSMLNDSNDDVSFCITATTADGRQGACHVMLHPTLLPPPEFAKAPTIVIDGDTARLCYELELQPGWRDLSDITWRRGNTVVATSNAGPRRTFALTEADSGQRLMATIQPRHQRCPAGEAVSAWVDLGMVPEANVLATDFSYLPCQWQPEVKEGYWTVDGHKPLDTAEYEWALDRSRPMWEYGTGFNGAVGRGLLQAQRGARLMYTPCGDVFGDMSLELLVDPTKTAGQGFGSATGQYMDVCLKFDTRALCGYGLRIVRTPKSARAVDFLLVEYKNGSIMPLTEAVTATCYRTGCLICLVFSNGIITADVTTATPRPQGSTLPHEVHLSAAVKPNSNGGIHIQHTGSCGESTTMLHCLRATWK